MPFTPTGNNAMLDAIGITHVSLHSGFPGTGGANEISGGSPAYARGAITFGAAAASERAQVLTGNGPSLFDAVLPADRVLSAGDAGTVRARPIGDIEADALGGPIRISSLGSVTATPTGKVR